MTLITSFKLGTLSEVTQYETNIRQQQGQSSHIEPNANAFTINMAPSQQDQRTTLIIIVDQLSLLFIPFCSYEYIMLVQTQYKLN